MTPHDVSPGSVCLVWWKCPVVPDHEWQATPLSRTKHKSGCPYCRQLTEDQLMKALRSFHTREGRVFTEGDVLLVGDLPAYSGSLAFDSLNTRLMRQTSSKRNPEGKLTGEGGRSIWQLNSELGFASPRSNIKLDLTLSQIVTAIVDHLNATGHRCPPWDESAVAYGIPATWGAIASASKRLGFDYSKLVAGVTVTRERLLMGLKSFRETHGRWPNENEDKSELIYSVGLKVAAVNWRLRKGLVKGVRARSLIQLAKEEGL